MADGKEQGGKGRKKLKSDPAGEAALPDDAVSPQLEPQETEEQFESEEMEVTASGLRLKEAVKSFQLGNMSLKQLKHRFRFQAKGSESLMALSKQCFVC